MSAVDLPIRFGADGLVPAVITDATTGDVLMVGFMNDQALRETRQSGLVHFWSRSRNELWKKGGTSGHIQEVQQISVNCDLNSLLIEVNQIGAVCHDGYATCFYRRLEPDNSLTVTRDRWFDPEDVYGERSGIAANTKRWWGAYEFLRQNDLSGRSSTSRLLRDRDDRVTPRIADELRELAGALDGTHRHATLQSDVALEGGQSCYWIVLRCVREGVTWESVRPDRALDITEIDRDMACATVASLLRHEADRWTTSSVTDLAARVHAAFALIAQACACAEVQPGSLIVADLNELRTRDYLDPYFAQPAG